MQPSLGLVQHLESQFGRIERGWAAPEYSDSAIQIVEFRGGAIPHVTVLSTLGVSSFTLQSPSGKPIRQELFLMIKPEQLHPTIPAVLDQIARERVRTDDPLLRGSAVQKQGRLFGSDDITALYCTLPIYYPSDYWTFCDGSDPGIVLCWLLPITLAEFKFVQAHGWQRFEGLLDKATFDLFDLARPSVVR